MPRGLIVDLITPFKPDGSVDGRSLGRHLDRVIPHADAVFLASPTAGEGKDLSTPLRQDLLEKASVIVRGRVPVLFWVSGNSDKETVETIRTLEEGLVRRRYDGPVFWVDTPLLYHSNRGLPDLYREMGNASKNPFILHNDPNLIDELGRPFKRRNIRTAVLKELSGLDHVHGLIFSGSLERACHYQRASRKRPRFRIYDGDENHFLEHPSLSGVVSIGANLAPRSWQLITRSSLQMSADQKAYPDHLGQIWEWGQYLRDLKDIYGRMPGPLVKEALAELNVIAPYADRPSSPESQAAAGKALRALIVEHGDA